jgi:dienelactone hydrolase
VKFATSLPYAQPGGAIVIGQSTGGWAAIAYNSVQHPLVAALISMAGGRGGHAYGEPRQVCSPEQFLAAAKRFGQTSLSPMLWVYAQNDSFFDPDFVRALYTTYTNTGAKVALAQVGPFGQDGHSLFYAPGGSAIWGPIIERYLAGLARGQLAR